MSDLRDGIEARVRAAGCLFSDERNFPIDKIENLAKNIIECFNNKGKIAFVGNGGSAAEAIHLAAEFTGKCVISHDPLPALCLNESQSALTAIANDYGVENMFSRLVKAHLHKGDILIAMSTSGESKNILNAIEIAKEKNVHVILWTGNSRKNRNDLEIWNVFSDSTPRIQEIHLTWGHILAEIVEINFSSI
jgi:D-sedoheptulose 7-phosphate isomerase